MDASIVVVSYNTRELLSLCLESIVNTVIGPSYEVIVVDNASADGSPEAVAQYFPWVRLIRNQDNRGFAAANNQGILASRGRCVLLLNSDAVLLPDAVHRMLAFMDSHPEVGIVGGKLLNPDGSFQSSYADFPNLLGEILLLTGLSRFFLFSTYPSYPEAASREPRRVDWVGGAFIMARREAVEVVGLLDEDYFMYAEEMDWCYRMTRSGWVVFYLPQAQAIHHLGSSSSLIPERKRAQLYRSKCLFLRKNRGWLSATTYRSLVCVVSLLKLVMWRSIELSQNEVRRQRARQNVASYRYVLSSM